MSFLRQKINHCFVILLLVTLANTQSDDAPLGEDTTEINVEETSTEGSTEAVPSELLGDMKRDQRSFLGDLWGDIFDDCECNNCNCNQGPLPNNFPPALPNNLPNSFPDDLPNDYNNNYPNNYYYNRPRDNFNRFSGGFKPWKAFKAFKKPWFGLFGDDCRGNCGNNEIHYHHGYNGQNGYNTNNNNNNYNDGNNYNPSQAPQKYEEPAADYEKPKYEEPAPVYEKPKYEEAAPAYEEPAPVYEEPKYEKPASIYKKPIHETSDKSYDCGSSACPPQPQLVYQPIIYFGNPPAQHSQDSSEEKEDSKDEVENKYEENYEEQSNYEDKHQSEEEHKETEEKKGDCSSEEDEENKKEHKSQAVIPIAPVFVPCNHGCGGPIPYSFPSYSFAAPPSVPLHQVINYNGVVPNYASVVPISGHDYHPYTYPSSTPAYYPTAPAFTPTAPAFTPAAPSFSPAAPAYSPSAPAYSPASPSFSPASPSFSPAAPAYSPAPVSSGCSCGHKSYGSVHNQAATPSHSTTNSLQNSYANVPSQSGTLSHGSDSHHSQTHFNQHHVSQHYGSHNHGSHHYIRQPPMLTPYDQPYLACPELFAAYNQQVAQLTSTNSLYK